MSEQKEAGQAGFDEIWENRDYIEWWLKKRAWKGPIRAMQAETAARMIPQPPDKAIRVLDLCAGFGALATTILKTRPRAKALCIDRSEEMIKLGRERTSEFAGRIEFAQASLDTADWLKVAAGTYDAVVSAQALLRFLTPARRKSLYQEIFNIMRPGGCFINVDDVCAPSATLRKRYNKALRLWLEDYTRETAEDAQVFAKCKEASPSNYDEPRKDGDLDQELAWLREAGFEDVDCFWKFGVMTVYGGFRPEKPGLMSSFLRVFKS